MKGKEPALFEVPANELCGSGLGDLGVENHAPARGHEAARVGPVQKGSLHLPCAALILHQGGCLECRLSSMA